MKQNDHPPRTALNSTLRDVLEGLESGTPAVYAFRLLTPDDLTRSELADVDTHPGMKYDLLQAFDATKAFYAGQTAMAPTRVTQHASDQLSGALATDFFDIAKVHIQPMPGASRDELEKAEKRVANDLKDLLDARGEDGYVIMQ